MPKQSLPPRRSGLIHTGDKVILLSVSRSLVSLNVVSNTKNLIHNCPLLPPSTSSHISIGDTGVTQGGGGESGGGGGCTHKKQLWFLVRDPEL